MGDRQMTASTTDDQAELRRRFIKAMREWEKVKKVARARGVECWMPEWPSGPDMRLFSGLMCGAKGKRTGRPCPLTCIYANGRCRFHGGLSTGPKTPEGREKASRNGQKARCG